MLIWRARVGPESVTLSGPLCMVMASAVRRLSGRQTMPALAAPTVKSWPDGQSADRGTGVHIPTGLSLMSSRSSGNRSRRHDRR
jgi:hypothetical protein